MWEGSKALLLNEYLEDKLRLQELKRLPQKYRINEENQEIAKLETKIKEFISGLNKAQLTSIIFMSLDIE